MKIQCDVCNKEEALIFCSADEAALCKGCDQRVHHANKLASKHERFSLINPSSSSSSPAPFCDICQDKRALLFCQQDRAILCRDCEIQLHNVNEFTKKHNRFLLTGIKLSEISDGKSKNGSDPVGNFKSSKKPSCDFSGISSFTSDTTSLVTDNNNNNSKVTVDTVYDHQLISGGGSTSSISEYLIQMLPGWHFEDFLLDSTPAAPFGFSKGINNNGFEVKEDMVSFLDVDFDKKFNSSYNQYENSGIWVPQAPAVAAATTTTSVFGQTLISQDHTNFNGIKVNRKLRRDDGFTVPQISQSVVGSKRSRPFC